MTDRYNIEQFLHKSVDSFYDSIFFLENNFISFLILFFDCVLGRHKTLNNDWSKIAKTYFFKDEMLKGPQAGFIGLVDEPKGLRDGEEVCKVWF